MEMKFLTAEWKNLLVVNYQVPKELLHPYVPAGTELESFEGKYFVSLVGFQFLKNKFLGFFYTWPCINFSEVNLRFYVKRIEQGEIKHGVTFIKEIVPDRIIANIAKLLYNEPYSAMPMESKSDKNFWMYKWAQNQIDYEFSAEIGDQKTQLQEGTFEHFILEHYWGYTPQRNGSTVEYEVKHPSWQKLETKNVKVSENISQFYPPEFESYLKKPPHSTFAAVGSEISVSFPNNFWGFYQLPINKSHSKGWVLYDGKCGFCAWWIPYWKPHIQKAGFDVAPVQETWVQETLGFKEIDLNNDIRLLLRNGKLINGADAYLHGMRQVWWSKPFGYLLSLPILRQLTWIFYKGFNKSRFIVSDACRLPPEIK